MRDFWCVRNAGTLKSDLEDLVEYQRFLKRFRADEQERRLKDILFEGKRFRTLPGNNQES